MHGRWMQRGGAQTALGQGRGHTDQGGIAEVLCEQGSRRIIHCETGDSRQCEVRLDRRVEEEKTRRGGDNRPP